MPVLAEPVARTLARDSPAIELPAQPYGELADVDHLLHFAERFLRNLSGFVAHEGREIGLVSDERWERFRERKAAIAAAGSCLRRLIIPAGDLKLAGTLYVPLRERAPAVVLVHGAGPAVRNDDYHDLARQFARKGVAALIYDKRGCGASGPSKLPSPRDRTVPPSWTF